jgi:hypothetical protein
MAPLGGNRCRSLRKTQVRLEPFPTDRLLVAFDLDYIMFEGRPDNPVRTCISWR